MEVAFEHKGISRRRTIGAGRGQWRLLGGSQIAVGKGDGIGVAGVPFRENPGMGFEVGCKEAFFA